MGHKMIDETDDQALSKAPYSAPVDERRFMADDKHHWETVKMDVYEDGKYQYTSGDDPVSHPSHYTTGSIEVKDYIADKNFNFFLGNVIKYVSRAGLKGDAVTDLKKARQYIDFELDRLSDTQ
jgi:hypothetical protein